MRPTKRSAVSGQRSAFLLREPLRLRDKLEELYGDDAAGCFERIVQLLERYALDEKPSETNRWCERDVVLICYGDQVQSSDGSALETLDRFLHSQRLNEAINTLHILPFFPYSSDDGFSVIDYRQVDPALGTWDDVDRIGQSFDLMFDLVLNHCSKQSQWFQDYLAGKAPYDRYFVEADPTDDLSAVTRPRSLPLLTPFETSRGPRHVWTTFSDDQVDLNFANPDVLLEMLDILLSYVHRGARIIRLDAIAYLWKEIGTPSIHHPHTHTVVKIMRDVLDEISPGTILLTETNVPHAENVSYFGDDDEAHMVYQFSLAPLLLDAFLTGDAEPFSRWLDSLDQTRPGTTYFNFTASHDGIGVRPLEGLVTSQRFDRLVDCIKRHGGLVSTRRNADGTLSPYELNVTYFSALGALNTDSLANERLALPLHVRRFLTTQGVMLSLAGIPGIYFHSLFGTENYTEGVEQTGRARTINRRKFKIDELNQRLADLNTAPRLVFDGYQRMADIRIRQPAFHPNAAQKPVDLGNNSLIAFLRTSIDARQNILVIANVSGETVNVDLTSFAELKLQHDLLKSSRLNDKTVTLSPYDLAWLS